MPPLRHCHQTLLLPIYHFIIYAITGIYYDFSDIFFLRLHADATYTPITAITPLRQLFLPFRHCR
jgi:hypothetical protein